VRHIPSCAEARMLTAAQASMTLARRSGRFTGNHTTAHPSSCYRPVYLELLQAATARTSARLSMSCLEHAVHLVRLVVTLLGALPPDAIQRRPQGERLLHPCRQLHCGAKHKVA